MMLLRRALFWDIAEYPIYLLATVHCGPNGGFGFSQFVDALVTSADVAYFEIDPLKKPDMGFMLRALKSQATLAEEVGPRIYRKLLAANLPLSNPLDAHRAGGIGDLIEASSPSSGQY